MQQNFSAWQLKAAKRFPYSAKRQKIRGDGPFVAVSFCSTPWVVMMFADPWSRDEKLSQWKGVSCPSGSLCANTHEAVDL